MFKPMLAGKAPQNLGLLSYPLLVSPKLDGVRAVIIDGVVLSRNLRPIPNRSVQQVFGRAEFNGLDGELIAGDPTDHDCFRKTSSATMAKVGESDVKFHIFDNFSSATGYCDRMTRHVITRATSACPAIVEVPHAGVFDSTELLKMEAQYLAQGYEGLMIRAIHGKYKHGRSTTREGALLKLKRFEDSEAVIQDFEELQHNDNELTHDALGRAKRQSLKENKRGADTLGALVVQDVHTGARFNVGTGFSDDERRRLWVVRDHLAGDVIKYRFFPSGSKDKPRFPTYLGFRSRIDF